MCEDWRREAFGGGKVGRGKDEGRDDMRFWYISGAMYPGVPHISVRRYICCSSMIFPSPKSATWMTASSAGVSKRRLSGLRSVSIGVSAQLQCRRA